MNEIQQNLVNLAQMRYGGANPDQTWKMFPLEAAIKAMKASGDFDAEKYLVENPDLFGKDIDPVEHYMRAGASAGRVLRARRPAPESLGYEANDKRNAALSQDYEARASRKSKTIPGMMAPLDRGIYFTYAEKYSQGDMIDAGCLVGCTTQNALDGSASAGAEAPPRMKVFDLFKPDAVTKGWLGRYCGEEAGAIDNFRPLFERNMSEHMGRLEIHEGDFAASSYRQKTPISFLGLDLCKSPALTEAAIRKFYPALIPGNSILIHQDYIHPWLPHIHISMELLSDYFEPELEAKEANCYVFRPIRPVTAREIDRLFGSGAPAPATPPIFPHGTAG